MKCVSISHRYGSTTVFTAFHVFIIPYFYRFSIFFSKKVGQPLHSKFPQCLDSTGFFIFVKISSEVHRLFGRFLLFSALFHAVFVLEALILLPWRFTDFFYIIFNNLHFNSTCTIHTYKGFPEFPAHSDRKWFLRHGSHRYSQYPAAIH